MDTVEAEPQNMQQQISIIMYYNDSLKVENTGKVSL